jgi:AcrR family transcriptional regulator
MLGETKVSRISVRRAAVTAEIVGAAWALAERDGLNGFSLRDVAKAVSMQPPSLYSYVASKHELFDLMFRQANEELIAAFAQARLPADPRAAFVETQRLFVAYCTAHPAQHTLLFQRTVPGFEPSAVSMASAHQLYAGLRDQLATLGVTGQQHLDLWTALVTGLISQQLANDPGGRRWERLLDEAVAMYLDRVAPIPRRKR